MIEYMFEQATDGKKRPLLTRFDVTAAREKFRETKLDDNMINISLRGDGLKTKDGLIYTLRPYTPTLEDMKEAAKATKDSVASTHSLPEEAHKSTTNAAVGTVENIPGGQRYTATTGGHE